LSLQNYLYADGDPTNGWDPSGHFTISEETVTSGIQALLFTINGISAAYSIKSAVNYGIAAERAFAEGDFWNGLAYAGAAVFNGASATLSIIGMFGAIPKPPFSGGFALASIGPNGAAQLWAQVVANPQLAAWLIRTVAPVAFAAFMATANNRLPTEQNHHVTPYGDNTTYGSQYNFKNHPLVQLAGVDLEKDPLNQILLENHRGAHSGAYLRAVLQELNDALKALGANPTQQDARRAFNGVTQDLINGIGNGTLRPYTSKDVYILGD
jgi:hypothetical protein